MLKVLKNAICFILFGCHEINVCIHFEINRYKIYSRKHEQIVSFRMAAGIATIYYHQKCNQPEVSTTSGSKVMAQIVVLIFLMTLTFDLCYIGCHIT